MPHLLQFNKLAGFRENCDDLAYFCNSGLISAVLSLYTYKLNDYMPFVFSKPLIKQIHTKGAFVELALGIMPDKSIQ